MTLWRRLAAGIAGTLAVLSLAAGGVVGYVRHQVVDRDAFERRAVDAIGEDAVRRAIADRIVEEIVSRGEPDLATARPLLENAAASIIASPPFRSVLMVAAGDVHRLLFARGRDRAEVELADLAALLISAVRSVDPRLARQLPSNLEVRLASLTVGDLAGGAPRVAEDVRWVATWLPPLGLALLLASVLLARDRRRAVIGLGIGAMAASALVLVLAGARPRANGALGNLSAAETDEAFSQAWWAFAGDLRTWALAAGGAALLTVMVAAWGGALPARWRQLVAAELGRVVVPPPRRAIRVVALLAAAGAIGAVALASDRAAVAIALGLAVLLLLVGLDELVGDRLRRATDSRSLPWVAHTPQRLVVALAATLAAVGVGTAVVSITREARQIDVGGNSTTGMTASARAGCNGLAQLCDRRLNEVLFPGTHNSMSASGAIGWVFTNQRFDVPRQLADGIRLLLLDPHWGRRGDGRVRTDLAAEGSSRNRAARALGSTGIRTAERLAGDIGIGSGGGPAEVYLCHTLCELGATRMADTLAALRRFLDDHRRDIVIVSLESSVPGAAIESEFERAGLVPRIAALQRDAPLPTLRELIAARKQLIVLGDHDTEGIPWYLDAGTFVQDTPIGPDGCTRRTGDATSPLLQVNHWIDEFPPRPSLGARIGGGPRLLDRVRRCERERGLPVSLLAVDYYDRTELLAIARRINAAPVRVTSAGSG